MFDSPGSGRGRMLIGPIVDDSPEMAAIIGFFRRFGFFPLGYSGMLCAPHRCQREIELARLAVEFGYPPFGWTAEASAARADADSTCEILAERSPDGVMRRALPTGRRH